MLTCKEASHLISEKLDRKLGLGERLSLRMHLWMCIYCRRFDRQMGILRRVMRKAGNDAHAEDVNATLSPEARERIRKALR